MFEEVRNQPTRSVVQDSHPAGAGGTERREPERSGGDRSGVPPAPAGSPNGPSMPVDFEPVMEDPDAILTDPSHLEQEVEDALASAGLPALAGRRRGRGRRLVHKDTAKPLVVSAEQRLLILDTSSSSFTLDFYANSSFTSTSLDSTGQREGKQFLGSANVSTDTGGNANFSVTLPSSVSLGQFIAATATDARRDTSEFSAAVGVKAIPIITWSAPANISWASAAALNTAVLNQTATLLDNGKVLIAGGDTGHGFVSSAELYDPASNTWSSAGSMATARAVATATHLNNGKVLITGGLNNNNQPLSSAELYDPATNTWSSAGNMATVRVYDTATLLPNGNVLVAGGYTGPYLSSAELYDPTTNSWSSAASMATPRGFQTATLLNNGKVLVAGGDFSELQSAELYDPVGNTWSSASSMNIGRSFQSATRHKRAPTVEQRPDRGDRDTRSFAAASRHGVGGQASGAHRLFDLRDNLQMVGRPS